MDSYTFKKIEINLSSGSLPESTCTYTKEEAE